MKSDFSPLKTDKLYRKIVMQISEYLSSGRIKPGDRLPAEREFQDKFKVSRASVREALRTLEAMGLVEIRRGSGTYVVKTEDDKFPRALTAEVMKSEGSPSHLMEARLLIEPGIAAQAAQMADEADIRSIEDALERMKKQRTGQKKSREPDRAFHNALAASTKNPVLIKICESLQELKKHLPWKLAMDRQSADGRPWFERYIDEHEAVLNAVRDHDPSLAEKKMAELLNTIGKDVTPGKKQET